MVKIRHPGWGAQAARVFAVKLAAGRHPLRFEEEARVTVWRGPAPDDEVTVESPELPPRRSPVAEDRRTERQCHVRVDTATPQSHETLNKPYALGSPHITVLMP